jgi:hypothetical protein
MAPGDRRSCFHNTPLSDNPGYNECNLQTPSYGWTKDHTKKLPEISLKFKHIIGQRIKSKSTINSMRQKEHSNQ